MKLAQFALLADARARDTLCLDLSKTALSESDVDAMIANAGAFSHLEQLDLGPLWFVLGPDIEAALRGLCANVDFTYLSPG